MEPTSRGYADRWATGYRLEKSCEKNTGEIGLCAELFRRGEFHVEARGPVKIQLLLEVLSATHCL